MVVLKESMEVIRIAQDFSKLPGGRYLADGEGNGTAFRVNFLFLFWTKTVKQRLFWMVLVGTHLLFWKKLLEAW